MEFQHVVDQLIDLDSAISVDQAERTVPPLAGLYSIHVVNLELLPPALQDHQISLAYRPHVIYVGRALGAGGLRQRLVEQDLRQGGPSTFFRGIGSVLGYLPPSGSLAEKANKNNYRFSRSDAEEIHGWMRRALRVCFLLLSAKGTTIDLERQLIQFLAPCLNTKHNPAPCGFVAEQRQRSRDIAGTG